MTVLNTKKLEELLVFIARHPGVQDLGTTKLWKLVYFIDTQALRDLGEPVTGSEFIKYEHGPVPSRGDKHLRKLSKDGAVSSEQELAGAYRLNSIKALRDPDLDVFSPEEQRIMHEVCRSQGRKKAAALSKLSHEEPAWHYADKLQKLSPALMAYGACEDEEGL